MLSMRGADEAYGLAARGSGRYPLFRRERLKGGYRSKVPRASPRHVCWLIGCAILAFLMLCAAILYIACLQLVHFSIRSGRLTVTVAAAGNDGTNPAAEFGEGGMGVVRLQWSNYTIENPNMLPQYLKGLHVALMGIRDAQDKHWFDFQNETRRKEGGHVLAWTFPLHCKNTRKQTNPGMSFAVHGETRLGAADAATVFSRNVTEGAAWPPVLLLSVRAPRGCTICQSAFRGRHASLYR